MKRDHFIVHLKGDNAQVLDFGGRCNNFIHHGDIICKFYNEDDRDHSKWLIGAIPLENILYIERVFTD